MDPALIVLAPARSASSVRSTRALLAGLALLCPAVAVALPDPMRPTPGAGAATAARAAGSVPAAGGGIPGGMPPAGDPASASATSSAAGDGLRLTSIRRPASGTAQALIGDQWVKAGDRIAGWRVLAVEAEEVRLERGAERLALRLWPKSLSPQPETETAAAAPPAAAERRTRSSR